MKPISQMLEIQTQDRGSKKTLQNQMVNFLCSVCEKPVGINHEAVCCDKCEKWVHIRYNNISRKTQHYGIVSFVSVPNVHFLNQTAVNLLV